MRDANDQDDRQQRPSEQGQGREVQPQKTDPAEERGERHETGKMIERGGKDTGNAARTTEGRPQLDVEEMR